MTEVLKLYYAKPIPDAERGAAVYDAVKAAIEHYGLSEYCVPHQRGFVVDCLAIGSGAILWTSSTQSKNICRVSYEPTLGMVNAWLFGLVVPVMARALTAKVSTTNKAEAQELELPPLRTFQDYLGEHTANSDATQTQRLAIRYAHWVVASRPPRPLPKELLGGAPW